MNAPYTLLNHTADLRIRVTGKTMAALFENAALALADLICDPVNLAKGETMTIEVAGDDPPDLMVNFLREMLYLWTGYEKLVKMVRVTDITNTALSARVTAECYTPRRHTILKEIKAVTYHQIDVSRTTGGWQAVVVFDV